MPGTDVYLVYHSSETSGYMSTIMIQLTPDDIPNNLAVVRLKVSDIKHSSGENLSKSVQFGNCDKTVYCYIVNCLQVAVEGLVYEKIFEADAGLKYKFAWDRRNAYNQKVYGIVTAQGM